jgi:hypothetical protein
MGKLIEVQQQVWKTSHPGNGECNLSLRLEYYSVNSEDGKKKDIAMEQL